MVSESLTPLYSGVLDTTVYRTCLVYLFEIITVCCNAGQDYDYDVFRVHPEDIMKGTITIFFSKKTIYLIIYLFIYVFIYLHVCM